MADEPTEADEVIAVDEAILDNAANEADDSDNEADGVLDNQLAELEKKDVEKVSKITVHLCCCWRPFSLTKYCAIFSKNKGYFCPIANNNQLGGGAIGVDFAIVARLRIVKPTRLMSRRADEAIVIVEIVSANETIAIDRAIGQDAAKGQDAAESQECQGTTELVQKVRRHIWRQIHGLKE